MDVLVQDLRYAWRALRRTPGFSLVVILVMSLAIGVNAMIFSMVYGILYRPWPLPGSDKLVELRLADKVRGENDQLYSFQDYFDLRDRVKSFSRMGGELELDSQVTIGGEAENMDGAVATADLFEATGVKPALGRGFTRAEERYGPSLTSVVISDKIWRERFGSDPQVLGRTMKVNGRVRTIVGVMPPKYRFPSYASFWIPCGFDPNSDQRIDGNLRVVGRLAPGVTIEQARTEVATLMAAIMREHPELHRNYTTSVEPIERDWNRDGRPFFILMLAAVFFVLLIACANVANLMLARAATRRREFALRVAIGAPRGRIVRQLLTESLLLAVVAGFFGLLVAHWGTQVWLSWLPIELPFYLHVALDPPVVMATIAVTALSAILFGLAPVAFATDHRLASAIREGSQQSGGSRAAAVMRKGLIVAEIVLALVLLIGAGLMLRSFEHFTRAGERLAVRGAVTGRVLLPIATYPTEDSRRQFLVALTERMRNVPGVRAFQCASGLPLDRNSEGRRILTPGMDPAKAPRVVWAAATPGFLKTMGVTLQRGREFTAADHAGAARVIVVNAFMAQKMWPGQDAIGKTIRFEGEADSLGALTVVGVCENMPQDVEVMHDEALVYVPYDQMPVQRYWLVVWSDADAATVSGAMRTNVRALDADMPVSDLRSLHDQFWRALWVKRLFMRLMIVFGVLALVIAAVGLYGVMAYSVAQRTQEIGIRMALGAERGTVVRMVLGQALQLTLIGCALGLVFAFLVTRFMAALLLGVSPTDPPTFVGVALILAASGLIAAWVPAMRATRVDPMIALRAD